MEGYLTPDAASASAPTPEAEQEPPPQWGNRTTHILEQDARKAVKDFFTPGMRKASTLWEHVRMWLVLRKKAPVVHNIIEIRRWRQALSMRFRGLLTAWPEAAGAVLGGRAVNEEKLRQQITAYEGGPSSQHSLDKVVKADTHAQRITKFATYNWNAVVGVPGPPDGRRSKVSCCTCTSHCRCRPCPCTPLRHFSSSSSSLPSLTAPPPPAPPRPAGCRSCRPVRCAPRVQAPSGHALRQLGR